ncbi:MAG: hypothetical protein JKY37_27870, partial [Nannocystaceae bacterium]|nr:hypothetical protein [Nannocystaceae bacterium]
MSTGKPQKRGPLLNRFACLGMALGALIVASGCASQNARVSDPHYPASPRVIVAEPGVEDQVQVVERTYAVETGGVVGYHDLSSGDRAQVVTYTHTYVEPIDSFPRVYWAGSWYYNVHGDFVFYDPYYSGWVYYYGSPGPLVACWNGYYPYSPYYWGVGYYGAGWYWGGVGVYGYHAYGIPVTNPHHHHHDHHQNGGGPGSRPSAGAPTNGANTSPSPGGPGSPMAAGPHRSKPSTDGPPVRDVPSRSGPPVRNVPGARDGAPARNSGATRTAAKTTPARSGGATRTTKQGIPSRATGVGGSMTMANGGRVTTIGGPPRRAAPRRSAKTIGMTDPFHAP